MPGNLINSFVDNRKKIVNLLFHAALTIELVLMIVEKSEISFPYESHVFRVTFLLTLLAVLMMKHDLKGWALIAVILGIAAYSYVVSGKNDMLRLALFVMAARDVALKKTMKYAFYVCVVGFLLIALLSVPGILGTVAITDDYGRDIGIQTRYVFGFGHPNTLFSSCYAVLLMWLWIYGRKAGVLLYAAAIAAAVPILYITDSRTGMAVVVFTFMLAVFFRIFNKLSEKKWIYLLGAVVTPILCIVSAILAAGYAEGGYAGGAMYPGHMFWQLDRMLNRRLSSIYYEASGRDAILSKWMLFSGRGRESYFDMGWVRLFYWYGIIPTAIISLAIMAVIYQSMKERDIWTVILVVSLGIYTLVEATFVTRYLGRDFFLIIGGVYLGRFFIDLFNNQSLKGATDA